MGLDFEVTGSGGSAGFVNFRKKGTQGLVIEQGTSNPLSPVLGQIFYRTDTGALEIWNGASFGAGFTVGTGLTLTGNQISLTSPVTVTNGGTGLATLTPFDVLCGGTTGTGSVQQVAGEGAVGYVLTSNGPATLPTWQPTGATAGINQLTGDVLAGPGTGSQVATLATIPFLVAQQYIYPVLTTDNKGRITAITGATTSLQTMNYTVTTLDSTLLGDATTGTVTFTLPMAMSAMWHFYYFKKVDSSANNVVIQRAGSDLIDGQTSVTLSTQYQSVIIQSDGTNWQKLSSASSVTASLGTTGQLAYYSSSNTIGSATGNMSANSNKITNVTDPTSAQDAATKNYVDTHAGVTGSGTTSTIPKWTSGSAIGNSGLSDNGPGNTTSAGLFYSNPTSGQLSPYFSYTDSSTGEQAQESFTGHTGSTFSSATNMMTMPQYSGGLVVVHGWELSAFARTFTDLILMTAHTSSISAVFTVVSSVQTGSPAPVARSYTISQRTLFMQMSGNAISYNVGVKVTNIE